MDITDPASERRSYHPIRKLRVVMSGLRFVVRNDFSVTYKMVLSVVLLVLCVGLRQWIDVILVLVVTGIVLVAEILNTAIERICDFIEPRHDPQIGVIKDSAAAAVGIAILVWMVVVGAEFWMVVRGLFGPG